MISESAKLEQRYLRRDMLWTADGVEAGKGRGVVNRDGRCRQDLYWMVIKASSSMLRVKVSFAPIALVRMAVRNDYHILHIFMCGVKGMEGVCVFVCGACRGETI